MARFSFSSSGAAAFGDAMKAFMQDAKAAALAQRNLLVTLLTERIMELTPVWEGDTMANWVWSAGAPSGEYIEPAGQDIPTGTTSKMSLGEEPRRPMNEDIVRKSLEQVLKDQNLDDMYLTNVANTAVDLEYGLLPTPSSTRVLPGGIVRLTIKEIAGSFR